MLPVLVDMGPFATVIEDEGVVLRSADVNAFTVGELSFPAGYIQADFEPELPYLAVVVDGAMEKSFAGGMSFGAGSALTMPAGAKHGARFGPQGARIVIVKARTASTTISFERLEELRGLGMGWLARRLAAELRASDDAAPLAAEGLALELLAAVSRESSRRTDRFPTWLSAAEELLRARIGDCVRLSELAVEIGIPTVQVARAFRAHYGLSVGEYGRRLRVEWAAAEIAGCDRPLAEIAVQAGFADQSHFTRLFKRHFGMTPGQYRAFQDC
jgi:AraC family transcriptional regulator